MNLKIFVLAFLVFVKICSIYSATSDTVHANSNSNSNCILILVQEETSFEQITIKGTLLGIYNNGICFDPGRKSLLYDPVPSIYKFKQIEKLLNENGEIIYPFKESPLDSNLFLQNKQSDCHNEKTKTGQKKATHFGCNWEWVGLLWRSIILTTSQILFMLKWDCIIAVKIRSFR